jgi:hypothetical protein
MKRFSDDAGRYFHYDTTQYLYALSQSCSLHSNSLITKVNFPQALGPATISVNGYYSFNVIL